MCTTKREDNVIHGSIQMNVMLLPLDINYVTIYHMHVSWC